MKAKNFTLFIGILLMVNLSVNAQLNTGTGVPWGDLYPTEPLLLDENFQGFEFFHSDEQPDDGNSDNVFDDDGVTVIYGYKNDSLEVPIFGSTSGKIKYSFKQCAFAPAWPAAYPFRDGGGQTANVSDGFVEISRDWGSTPPTIEGSFIVDLRAIEFVEVIQWSHSSTGGNKRGVMCQFSLDDGITWDTLRYQPGDLWGYSFTKDPATGTKFSNGYRCDPSAYGMTWEDGIYTGNVMLKFVPAGGNTIQTPRIHDLKVYGTFNPPTAVSDIIDTDFRIYSSNKKIIISKPAKVAVYNITGNLVRIAENTERISMDNYPVGIYIVKAQVGKELKSAKVVIK